MRVVVKDPVHGGVADVLAVMGAGLFGDVGTKQVVEGVPAGDVLGEQVLANQFGQRCTGLVWLDRGQAGHGGQGDVRAAVQAQQ
ncbi:MAG TPA: hypothetical protein VMV17_16950, partial [Streptosporangiaceae bacterium]|nr:hypothetical protein [Streptosporangiaceae bacterium]